MEFAAILLGLATLGTVLIFGIIFLGWSAWSLWSGRNDPKVRRRAEIVICTIFWVVYFVTKGSRN